MLSPPVQYTVTTSQLLLSYYGYGMMETLCFSRKEKKAYRIEKREEREEREREGRREKREI